MHDDTDRPTRARRDEVGGTAKKPYSKPRVEDYGSVADLTRAGGGTIEDAGGGAFDFSGGSG
jgi:hypothetical protein